MDNQILQFFDLVEDPFSATANPRFVSLTPMHAAALKKTEFTVDSKNGLAVVFGDTGTGKSSLARMLHQSFLDKGYISILLTNPRVPTPNLLLRMIIQEYRLPTTRAFLDNIAAFKNFLLKEAVENQKTVVLMIDEAHTLNRPYFELLRQLLNFETNETKLLQLVLFAQEELRPKIMHPSLRNFKSRIYMASTLDKLSQSDFGGIIEFRWKVASNGRHSNPFTSEAIEYMYEMSLGIPREAIVIASNSLLTAFFMKERTISKGIVEAAASDRLGQIGRIEELKLITVDLEELNSEPIQDESEFSNLDEQ
jgi:type II secretory pathway predicted ATPase ExeA